MKKSLTLLVDMDDTIENLLSIADGAVVGTTFKYDGKFENAVDSERVKRFMDKVCEIRKD